MYIYVVMSGYPHVFGNEREVLFRVLVIYNLLALCLCCALLSVLEVGTGLMQCEKMPLQKLFTPRRTFSLLSLLYLSRKQLGRLHPVFNLSTHSLHAVHTPIFYQTFLQFFDIPFCEAAGDSPSFDSPSFDSLQSRAAYNNPSKAQILHSKHHSTISSACHGGTSILAYTIRRRARGNLKKFRPRVST